MIWQQYYKHCEHMDLNIVHIGKMQKGTLLCHKDFTTQGLLKNENGINRNFPTYYR